jgi:hypothetical protein
LKSLTAEQQADLGKIEEKWAEVLDQVVEEPVSAFKKDIFVEKFGLIWLPYYAFLKGEEWLTVPAFRWGEK